MENRSYFAYARHALVVGLRHLGIRSGDHVALPELICRDVLSSVQAVGGIPVFYPVNKLLRPADVGTSSSAKFVLMVNYFGFAQSVNEFSELWPTASLIEDNAHGHLSRDVDGVQLGRRTDVGITSFRKTFRVPDGAYLDTRDTVSTELLTNIEDRPPSPIFRIRDISSQIERRTGIPTQFLSRLVVRLIRQVRTGAALPLSHEATEHELPSPVALSQWSFDKLHSMNDSREVQRRRELFEHFLGLSVRRNVQPVFTDLSPFCSPYGFPFFAPVTPSSFRRSVRKLHCEVISWPDLPTAIQVPQDHFYRQLKVVNFL